jgi:hypothetical protein
MRKKLLIGEVPEWLKGTDCKSVGLRLRRFESFPLHHFDLQGLKFDNLRAGVAQLARVSAFQAEGCGFETRLPLQSLLSSESGLLEKMTAWVKAELSGPCSSVVEHTLGKGEVAGSAPAMGSTFWVSALAIESSLR